jgi:hypothetical protein
MLVLTNAALQGLLKDAVSVVGTPNVGTFSAVKVMLFTDANGIGPNTVITDKTEATYTGYARSATVTFGPPSRGTEGMWRIVGQSLLFQSTDNVTPNEIFGAGLVSGTGAGAVLLAAELFDQPRTLDRAGQGFTYVPELQLPLTGYGAGTIID